MATRSLPHTGDLPSVPGAANSQTTRVLDDAVATEDAVCAPQHVGGLQLPASPHRKSTSGYKSGRQPGPSYKDDANTDTASPLKTYLK